MARVLELEAIVPAQKDPPSVAISRPELGNEILDLWTHPGELVLFSDQLTHSIRKDAGVIHSNTLAVKGARVIDPAPVISDQACPAERLPETFLEGFSIRQSDALKAVEPNRIVPAQTRTLLPKTAGGTRLKARLQPSREGVDPSRAQLPIYGDRAPPRVELAQSRFVLHEPTLRRVFCGR